MKTIIIDTDTLNNGADLDAMREAIEREVFGVEVEFKSTGAGTEFRGFDDADEARATVRAIVDRLDF
jgi:hypothetical protein